jgi:hypothetical protein
MNIVIFNSSDKEVVVNNGFKEQMTMWYAHGNHYDFVVSKTRLKALAVCQGMICSPFSLYLCTS